MKVLNLACPQDHQFEGWFASEADFEQQGKRGLLECPLCGSREVSKRPTAPRLNLRGPQAAAAETTTALGRHEGQAPTPSPQQLQGLWMKMVREVLHRTEDVGPRLAQEARAMAQGEVPERAIRGQATPQERAELHEEGIELLPLPVPKGLTEPLQ